MRFAVAAFDMQTERLTIRIVVADNKFDACRKMLSYRADDGEELTLDVDGDMREFVGVIDAEPIDS